ncbi:MAG TPA: RsmG family class I SAM-dependent methyltransferase [Pyrinomonadaceae bacterium]
MRTEFVESIEKHQSAFGLNLADETINRLVDYHELIQRHNALLHLVAPTSAEEFAVRHILESLTLLEFLPPDAKFADVGTGAGLPSIPCLIAREDLRGVLVESKPKKANFLGEAIEKLNLEKRARVINKQFEEAEKPVVSFVACRALDKFVDKLPRLLRWAGASGLLFFGGDNLRQALQKHGVDFREKLMPLSEQRFLFSAENRKKD